jgi:AcrR family transcriptional regulator
MVPNEGTREQLILAAERLFAERGIGAVSLREINKAAGQRNTSAIHYHFGSKEALVEAIFQRHMSRLNERRTARLQAVEQSGQSGDLRAVLRAVISPLVEALEGGEEERNYLRFFSKAMIELTPHVRAAVRAPFSEAMHRGDAMIRAILGDVPQPLLVERSELATELVVHAVARRAQLLHLGVKTGAESNTADFVANLVDFIAGGLSAEVQDANAPAKQTIRRNTAKALV